MIVLLLGFRATAGDAGAEPLYLGPDASAAIAIQEAPPEGILRTHLYQGLPDPTRRRHHEPAPAKTAPAKPEPSKPEPAKPEPKNKTR